MILPTNPKTANTIEQMGERFGITLQTQPLDYLIENNKKPKMRNCETCRLRTPCMLFVLQNKEMLCEAWDNGVQAQQSSITIYSTKRISFNFKVPTELVAHVQNVRGRSVWLTEAVRQHERNQTRPAATYASIDAATARIVAFDIGAMTVDTIASFGDGDRNIGLANIMAEEIRQLGKLNVIANARRRPVREVYIFGADGD